MAQDTYLPKVLNRPRWNRLTKHEQIIIGWVKRGLANREIAEKIGSSDHAVKKCMDRVFHKLDTHDRTHAIVLLLEEKHAAELHEARTQVL